MALIDNDRLLSSRNLLVLTVLVILLGGASFMALRQLPRVDRPVGNQSFIPEVEVTLLIRPLKVPLVTRDPLRGHRLAGHLEVQIALGLDQESFTPEIERRRHILEDQLITLLGTQSLDQLKNVDHRAHLREKIREAVNDLLPERRVARVWFPKFYLS